jgi:hypothetical protein
MIRERHNPNITVLGVVLTLVGARHVRVIRKAREQLDGLLGGTGVKVYGPVIRESVVAGSRGTAASTTRRLVAPAGDRGAPRSGTGVDRSARRADRRIRRVA